MAKRKRLSHPALQSTSSKGKHDARGETYLMMARDKLKGALEDLLDSDSSSSDDDEGSQPATPSKQLSVKKESKPPVIRRRKRKLAIDLDLAFQHTFVMKLFDRSVDLAQFQEDTPLYPICRAWIANQPRVPLPYPPMECPDIKKEEENMFDLESEEVKDFCNLPPPSSPPWNIRIPPISTPALQGVTFDYSSENLPTADQLLKEHVARWSNVHKQWIEAAQTNESRFKKSGQILSNMYKRVESSVAQCCQCTERGALLPIRAVSLTHNALPSPATDRLQLGPRHYLSQLVRTYRGMSTSVLLLTNNNPGVSTEFIALP